MQAPQAIAGLLLILGVVAPSTAIAGKRIRHVGRLSTGAGEKPNAKVEPESHKTKPPELRMSPAIACRSIEGFEKYDPLKVVELTGDEKLLIYYRPEGFRTSRREDEYVVHFTQGGRIRRKGEKFVLRAKAKLLDVESAFPGYPECLYLRNTVSLKGLPPGDYEFDIILHDENSPGSIAFQTIGFRVIPPRPVVQPPVASAAGAYFSMPRRARRRRSKPRSKTVQARSSD
jgi:hypothetical protein